MSQRPLGHNPWFAPVRPTDQTPNPEHDDADQKALRAFGRQLDELMFEHDIGGVLLLTSKKSMSWMMSFPRWSKLKNEGLGLRLETKISNADGQATITFLASVRDLAFEVHGFFAQFYKQIDRQLQSKGYRVDHRKLGSPGQMGPHSGMKAKEAELSAAAVEFNPETCITAATLRSIGVELDPAIPDAAWVTEDSVRRVGEPDAPDLKLQIWEPFRWLERPVATDPPPLLKVNRSAE